MRVYGVVDHLAPEPVGSPIHHDPEGRMGHLSRGLLTYRVLLAPPKHGKISIEVCSRIQVGGHQTGTNQINGMALLSGSHRERRDRT